MPIPYSHQLEATAWLSGRRVALLADEPRVGKTGAAIMAAESLNIKKVLVVTTASGRPVWHRAIAEWAPRSAINYRVVGWPELIKSTVMASLLPVEWDLLLVDEAHFAKNPETKRTQAVFGKLLDDGEWLDMTTALVIRAGRTWLLTGTPVPNAPNDLYPQMRALCVERLEADPKRGWPDVVRYRDFVDRYCIVKLKRISPFRKIPVVIGGRNLDELAARLEGFWMRRTQKQVGITEPIYETFPLRVSDSVRRQANGHLDKARILEAAERGDTRELEMHLGPLRRLTGGLKAQAVIDALHDEFDSGLDKVVLPYWHRDVGATLLAGLASYGVTGIDGATPPAKREAHVRQFQTDPKCRVFLAQIVAAGEAIDLSSSNEMLFVETSFTPKDMMQMSKRITNLEQKRQPRVRVAVLEGSIDEALEQILLRKWSAIRVVLKGD